MQKSQDTKKGADAKNTSASSGVQERDPNSPATLGDIQEVLKQLKNLK